MNRKIIGSKNYILHNGRMLQYKDNRNAILERDLSRVACLYPTHAKRFKKSDYFLQENRRGWGCFQRLKTSAGYPQKVGM